MMKIKVDTESIETIEKSFLEIAEELMVKHVLKVGKEKYRISSLEFYYYNENCQHCDTNSHSLRSPRAKERQLLNSKWYLHKKSINLNYRRKGIDFTFGDGKNCGGALLKEVTVDGENGDKKFSQSKFVDELIRVLNPVDADLFLRLIEEDEVLTFVASSSSEEYKIAQRKRKGLAKQDGYTDSPYAFCLKKVATLKMV